MLMTYSLITKTLDIITNIANTLNNEHIGAYISASSSETTFNVTSTARLVNTQKNSIFSEESIGL